MSELGRPGTIDLVADRGGDVLGYVMVSRYADVWHILNVCVREAQRGQGIGGRLLDDALRAGRAAAAPRLHPRGARVERDAPSASIVARASWSTASAPATTPTTARTRSSCGGAAVPRTRTARMTGPDPRDRDLLRRDRRRRRRRAGRSVSSVVASQAELHAPYGGVVPEVAARHHLGTVNARGRRAPSPRPAWRSATCRAVAVTQRPGLIGALLIGVATAKAIAYAARKAAGDGRPPPRPHRRLLAAIRWRSTRPS